MPNVTKKNQRLKVYGIAIPILIAIVLIGGSIGQYVGEMYRGSYYEEGFKDAIYWVNDVVVPEVWEEGFRYGEAAGLLEGFRQGYVSGIFAMDDPYHAAALGFEKMYPWLDVTLLAGGDQIIALAILLPTTPPEDLDAAVFNEDMLQLLESVWDGQNIVRIFVIQYNARNDVLMVVSVVDFVAETLFEYRFNEGTQGASLISFPIECPDFLIMWPTNPYWEASEAKATGGETNPQ